MKSKILILQPGYAHYRNNLFEILNKRHDIKVLYENALNVYPGAVKPGKYAYDFLEKHILGKQVALLYYLFESRPDIVISSISTSYRSLISYIYAFIFGKKFILWTIEWREHPNKKNRFKNILRISKYLIARHLIRNCHAIVVGGSASKRFAILLGKKESQIFLGFQCSNDLLPLVTQGNLKNGNKKKFTFLYLSRIVPRKGLDHLINAFSKLRNDQENIRLIVGGDGSYRKHCERLARSKKTKDIIFLGSVDPKFVGNLFKIADVFVFPCHFQDITYEPWGLVVNEAMSMALPVITTNAVGATYDLIKHQSNGIVVKENSTIDLYRAMCSIVNEDLLNMKRNARQTFEKWNNFEKMADGFSSAINHVMNIE
jgi:glycosyltransferase involved in cell wall biosynthesis